MVSDPLSQGRGEQRPGPVLAGPRIFTRFEDRPELYLVDEPIVAGGARDRYVFERHRVPPGELHAHVFDDHMLLLPTGTAAVPFQSLLNGRQVNGAIVPGRFRFLAAGDKLSTRWNEPVDCILVALRPGLIQSALGEEVCDASPELISNVLPHDDLLLAHLVSTLECHLTSDRRGGSLFEQSLLTTVAAHLLTAYGNGKRRHNHNAPLTRWKRTQIEDYVRQNLGHRFSLDDIAQAVELSPYHLSRSFKATTGQGLWQFVLECRVRDAMRMIRRGRPPSLAHIAVACGFESYSQFIAAFRKFLGQLPSEYRTTHQH